MASAMIGTIPVSLSGLLAFYGIGPMVMTYFGHSLVQDYRDPSRVSLLNGQMFLCGDKQMVRVVNGPGEQGALVEVPETGARFCLSPEESAAAFPGTGPAGAVFSGAGVPREARDWLEGRFGRME